jgi:hypothetical protein
MERLAGRFWPGRRGARGAGRPAAGVRPECRGGDPAPAPAGAEPLRPLWSATLHLGGGRALEASYPVDPPLLTGAPPPRIAVRSLPAAPRFSLDLRLPTPAAPLYVGVLHFTDGRSRPGLARVAGTWSAPTTTFWGTWLGASSQRGTVRITLCQR